MTQARHYIVKTLGCKANLYDSQLIEVELQRQGWSPAGEAPAALCIVNSCTVTDEADRQSRKLAARLSRENPGARIVVTGCAAEVDPERIAKSKGIDYVIGNRDKPQLVSLILKKLDDADLNPKELTPFWPLPSDIAPPLVPAGARTRAFLKIQEGCNAFCTYCIIPYGRGPSRSLRPREVLEQVRSLVVQGAHELVITGTNIGDYGTDWSEDPALDELLELILAETTLRRLRMSSLDPAEITPRILALAEREPRFCPHFHVSLQSTHDRVLRLMKRKYRSAQVEGCLRNIARLPAGPGGAFVGMDVITGFPGETAEEFEAGLKVLACLPWSRLHVFPYSERKGTPATRLPGAVPHAERSRRARLLSELSFARVCHHYEAAIAAFVAHGSRVDDVLWERASNGPGRFRDPSGAPLEPGTWVAGYTPNYLRVLAKLPDGTSRQNTLGSAHALGVARDPSSGEAAILAELA